MNTMNLKKKDDSLKQDALLLKQQEQARLEQMAQQGSGKELIDNSGGYVESDAVRQAKENLNSLQKPGAYQSQWQQNLNDVISKIQNREKFTYDLNGDALYQQYKDQYMTQGQQAMMDTMGQAAALTGGYGSSYGQMAGQQTYQGYLQQLNDKVPELYQLALDQYNRETQDLYNQYGLYTDMDNTEYGRYRDTVADYNTDRDYLTGRYDSERNFDYNQYTDERDFAYQVGRDAVADKQWQDEFDYQKVRDSVADEQWQKEFDEAMRQFNVNTDLTKEQMATQKEQWQKEFDEDVRQFDTNTAITKEQMATQKEQWKAEYDLDVKQADREYELAVKQIEEDVRHNKVSESQGQAQIDLAKEELDWKKAESAAELTYKYTALDKEYGGSSSGSSGSSGSKGSSSSSGSKGSSSSSGSKGSSSGGSSNSGSSSSSGGGSGFSGKSYSEAVAYVKSKGVDNSKASSILTKTEFSRWSHKGEFDNYEHYLKAVTEDMIEQYAK